MKKTALLFILFIATYYPLFACLNGESKVLKNGFGLYEDHHEGNIPYGHHFDIENGYKKELKELEDLYKETKDLDYLSDKGLLLIILGKYTDAINLYLEIEKKEPNRYSTASNIGTAYELIGQNENALKWLKKSVKIDPKSHNHSEWIHVKILEAKIKGAEFYTSNFLINTDFGSQKLPKSKMSKKELEKLSDALYFQLNERISFVKPKDTIVAQLLFELGNIAFLLGNYHDAKADYKSAIEYGYSDEIIQTRLAYCRQYIADYLKEIQQAPKIVHKNLTNQSNSTKINNPLTIIGIIGISILLLATFIAYKYKNRQE